MQCRCLIFFSAACTQLVPFFSLQARICSRCALYGDLTNLYENTYTVRTVHAHRFCVCVCVREREREREMRAGHYFVVVLSSFVFFSPLSVLFSLLTLFEFFFRVNCHRTNSCLSRFALALVLVRVCVLAVRCWLPLFALYVYAP